MNFGEYFRKLRTEHHMTQRDIASRLGVTRQAISHWENNKNLPDLEMLVQIADTFNLSLDQLLANGNVTNESITDHTPLPSAPPAQPLHHHRHYTHKEIRRLKLNLLTFCIGAVLLFFGVGYVGIDNGMERRIKIVTIICKSYILVPLGFLFIFGSIIAFILFELKHLARNIHRRNALKESDDTDNNCSSQISSVSPPIQNSDDFSNITQTSSAISDPLSGKSDQKSDHQK